jgi:hypothetical protein
MSKTKVIMASVYGKLNLIIPPSSASIASAKNQQRAVDLAKETLSSLSQEQVLSLNKVQSAFEAATKRLHETMSHLSLKSRDRASALLLDFQNATTKEFTRLENCRRVLNEPLLTEVYPFPRELNTVHLRMETESGLWHRAIQTVVRTESPLYNFQTEEGSITEAELNQLAEEVDREFNDVPAALKAVHRVVADVEKEILADLMNEMIKEMAVMQAKKKTDADKDCAQNIS